MITEIDNQEIDQSGSWAGTLYNSSYGLTLAGLMNCDSNVCTIVFLENALFKIKLIDGLYFTFHLISYLIAIVASIIVFVNPEIFLIEKPFIWIILILMISIPIPYYKLYRDISNEYSNVPISESTCINPKRNIYKHQINNSSFFVTINSNYLKQCLDDRLNTTLNNLLLYSISNKYLINIYVSTGLLGFDLLVLMNKYVYIHYRLTFNDIIISVLIVILLLSIFIAISSVILRKKYFMALHTLMYTLSNTDKVKVNDSI